MSKQVNDLRLILVRISCGDHLLITYLLERPHSVQFQVNTYTVLDFCQRMLKWLRKYVVYYFEIWWYFVRYEKKQRAPEK